MAIGKDIFDLSDRIGYSFKDVSLLECALTHVSYTNEQRTRGIVAASNERLEFLGDAVLEIVISEYLYSNFSKYREGTLTKMRQQLVCEKTLCEIALEIDLGSYINLGNGEELTACRKRPKILADALEALIAAVYLDSLSQGTDAYRRIVMALFEDAIEDAAELKKTDYKTTLQQMTEQDGSSILEYVTVEENGPEHSKQFTVVAYINNNEVGRGSANTKKSAEMLAAKAALNLFGVKV